MSSLPKIRVHVIECGKGYRRKQEKGKVSGVQQDPAVESDLSFPASRLTDL